MRFGTVEITREEIAEFDGKYKIFSIERNQIIDVHLKFGMSRERILATIVSGVFLIAVGIVLGVMPLSQIFIKNDFKLSVSGWKPFVCSVPSIIIGIYLIKTSLERRYYLLVNLINGTRKVIFKDKIDYNDLENYIRKINNLFGYNIQSNLREL